MEEEGRQEDCIVSHSTYPAPYAADIDSTLVLTGLKLATTVDITFEKINLSSDCSDYVEINGLKVADGQSAVGRKICDNLLLDKTVQFHTVSSHISFHFQTKHAAGGQGFRLKYKGTCVDITLYLLLYYNSVLSSILYYNSVLSTIL